MLPFYIGKVSRVPHAPVWFSKSSSNNAGLVKNCHNIHDNPYYRVVYTVMSQLYGSAAALHVYSCQLIT